MSWDNFNESGDLKAQVEAYRRFTGYYPESVHADRIYRTLLEPSMVQRKKKQALEDERIRNAIEGKFGACGNEDLV
jgi:hypothetical protein